MNTLLIIGISISVITIIADAVYEYISHKRLERMTEELLKDVYNEFGITLDKGE